MGEGVLKFFGDNKFQNELAYDEYEWNLIAKVICLIFYTNRGTNTKSDWLACGPIIREPLIFNTKNF